MLVVDSFPTSCSASPTGFIHKGSRNTPEQYCAGAGRLPDAPRLAKEEEETAEHHDCCREEDLAPHSPTKRKFVVDQKARRHGRIGPHKQVSFSPDIKEILALHPAAHHNDLSTDPSSLRRRTMCLAVVDHDGHVQEEQWYSKTELDTFKKLAHTSVLKFHKTKNANQVKESFCNLLAECAPPSPSKRRREDLGVLPKNAQKDAQQVLRALESSDMRGLEAFAHRAVQQHRHWHVRNIVAVQAAAESNSKLSSTSASSTTLDSPQERLLRSVSMRSSRASKIIARLLGHGDSIQVASMIQEELGIPDQRCPVRRAA
jgi:hypothetical protein